MSLNARDRRAEFCGASHLMGFFYRTIRIVENGIKPAYVFDGKPPELKSGVVSFDYWFSNLFLSNRVIFSSRNGLRNGKRQRRKPRRRKRLVKYSFPIIRYEILT